MNNFKLMIVEDYEQDLQLCRDCIRDFQREKPCTIDTVECRAADEALSKLDTSFDGAIIDMKLADQGDEGKQIINKITESYYRIPIVILTGTPDVADGGGWIDVLKKGDPGAGYADILNHLWDIYNTGLTRITGGRGEIEKNLSHVFINNLLPQRKKWIEYGKSDSTRTEKALLRYTLNHMLQLLDADEKKCFPEEMYLSPPLTEKLRTGSIVKDKERDQMFVVLSPACDLVIRSGGKCNTDRILIVKIDSQKTVFSDYPDAGFNKGQKNELEKAFRNNKTTYYHWLPKTDFFEGGFVNFRKHQTIKVDGFHDKYDRQPVQISPSFIKDITARFSSYYARQGQPDIEYESYLL